jgi:hypothetical protein
MALCKSGHERKRKDRKGERDCSPLPHTETGAGLSEEEAPKTNIKDGLLSEILVRTIFNGRERCYCNARSSLSKIPKGYPAIFNTLERKRERERERGKRIRPTRNEKKGGRGGKREKKSCVWKRYKNILLVLWLVLLNS